MKLDNAVEFGEAGAWTEAEVRLSPGSRTRWFVMLRDTHNKSYILADNEDNAITSADVNELARLIRTLGLKAFSVIV